MKKENNLFEKVNSISTKKEYSEVAMRLIEAGRGHSVAENLEKFQGLNHQEVAMKLIESEKGRFVAENLEKFQGLNHQELAMKLIESVEYERDSVAEFLEKFQGLNHQEVAMKLIESDGGHSVVKNLEKFQGLNHQEVAMKLIESKKRRLVAKNLEKFQGLNHQEVAMKLIESGEGRSVAEFLEKFQGLNHQEVAMKLIESGEGRSVAEFLEKFQLSPQKFYEVIKEKYYDLINEIETKIPKLADQLSKSVESLLDIINNNNIFSKIKESVSNNPFLLEALDNNPRYSSKLIIKYHKFDKVSKNNIKELFINEAEILKENPGINKDSIEFRILMQNKLTSHVNNQEILNKLEISGVNTEEWLNFNKEKYFTLGETEGVKFSDQIKTPIFRIKEILNKYQDSIIDVLSEYKKELQESSISNSESEKLKQKILKQKENIASETDEKKKQGMEKGLIVLETKEASLKPVSVWSKIQSDIYRLKSMIDNIFKFHDACIATEAKLETITNRQELMKKKDVFKKNKIQLQDNFKEFELFFESYETNLQELIIPSLGQDRSEALLQEIEQTLSEELNHYNADVKTLKSIFNEKNEDKNKLNGRDMRISISSRSTQDLYLGNYCPCCICIDSQYHGAESPISDYVTDLGMQNIVVYDEKTNSPVIACWTFIGKNYSNNEPIMVIDNIEANTDYTNDYPNQFKEVINQYISDYAKETNIKTILQGKHNNDLIVFPLGEVEEKLGGYNRLNGYFLEAEK
jgi:Mor family transcriptional regulator